MQKSRRNAIATLFLLGCAGDISTAGCGDQPVESNGSVDYLVLFATGTTEERILEIVRLTESTILEYPQSGFSLEYKIHVPVSHGLVEDGALFHRFPEVEAVTRAVVGHFY